MKIKNLLLLLMAVFLAVFFIVTAQHIDIIKFQHLEAKLTSFLKTANELNLEILELQRKKESYYDSINAHLAELIEIEGVLESAFTELNINRSSYLEKHFEELKVSVDELGVFLDEFKSFNSVFNSSLNFLFLLHDEMDEGQRKKIQEIFEQTIQYSLYLNPVEKKRLDDLLLTAKESGVTETGTKKINQFYEHVGIISSSTDQLNLIISSLEGLKISETVEDLKLTAEIEYEMLIEKAAFQKKGLFYLTLILFCYLAFILIRLKRITKEVKEFNRDLEYRVELRTKELSHAKNILEDEKTKALDALKSKSDFLANMSHEIRTPMNAILGFGDLLKKTNLDHKQKGYLNTIETSGHLLLAIIDDILDYSKLSTGKIQLEERSFNLEDLVFDVFKMIVARIKDNPYDTYVDIADDVPRWILGDPTRIKQVLVNLLGNAVKFTKEGSVGLIVRPDPILSNDKNVTLIFTVKDTGIGIAKDKLGKIFESFSQADESTTRKYGGTGLGLSISRQLVEIMGGEISIESEVGLGSSFIFNLPFKVDEDQEHTQNDLQKNIISDQTAFIIDDNKISSKLIKTCCEKLDMIIMGVADSPQSALNKLDTLLNTKNIVPDIIYSDILFDGMTGFEFAQKIRSNKKYQHTKLIAITSNIQAEDDPDSQLFDAFIHKPVSLREILRTTINQFDGAQEEAVATSETSENIDAKILVVEDVQANRMLMEVFLGELGCSYDFAVNGKEALEKVAENDYDLILMDLQMPVMGGVEATTKIRKELKKNLPIIALSAAVLEEDRENALSAGMNDFLKKPVQQAQLKDILGQYISS